MTVVIKSPRTSSASGLLKLRRDEMLLGAGTSGVPFMFDLDNDWCFPTASSPADGDTIKDLAEVGDGDLQLVAGQSFATAGGGLNFAPLTADPAVVRGGAGLAAIASGSQRFMVVIWARLPSSADWNTDAIIAPLFTTAAGAGGYTAEPDMLTIAQMNAPALTFRRQTGGSNVASLNIFEPDLNNHQTRVSQIAYWRTASEIGARVRSSGGTTVVTGAVGSNNVDDFSGKRPRWGVSEAFNNLAGIPAHQDAANWRLYRGWVENLESSQRDPLTVLDRDYAFVTSRGVFS